MKANWLGAKSLEKQSDKDNDVLMQIQTSNEVANHIVHKEVNEAANHIEQTDLFNDDINFYDSQFGLNSIEKENNNVLISPIAPPVTDTNERSVMIESSNVPTTSHDKLFSTKNQGELGSDVISNPPSTVTVNNANTSNFYQLLGKCQTCLAFNSKKNKP